MLSGIREYYQLFGQGDHQILCPSVDTLCVKGAPSIFMLRQARQPGHLTAGRTNLDQIMSICGKRAPAAFPGAPGRKGSPACLPLRPSSALANSRPCTFEPAVHSLCIHTVWPGAGPALGGLRPKSRGVNTQERHFSLSCLLLTFSPVLALGSP